MTEFELKRLIEQATTAIEDYQSGKIEKSHWQKELKESVEKFVEKSHMLNTSGQQCPRCGGTGRA